MSERVLTKITVVIKDKKILEQLGQEAMLRKQCGNLTMGIDWFAYVVICAMLMKKEEVVFEEVPGE